MLSVYKKNQIDQLFIFRNRFKLSSLIAPLLNNSQAEQKIAETESISINNNNTN